MTLTNAVIQIASAIKGINPKLKSMQRDIDALKEQVSTNPNLGMGDLRTAANGDIGVTFHDSHQFIVTSSWGKWIRLPALDHHRAGTFTVSFLTDRNVSRIAFYADGKYQECYQRNVMGLRLFYSTFEATKIQAHMYIEANKGHIYDYKLEEGYKSTLSHTQMQEAVITNMMERLDILEKKR